MFNPFSQMMSAPSNNHLIYCRHLGWSEYDEEGDKVPAMITVVNATIGYNVFRVGQDLYHLEWFHSREDAIDWAVDRARQEVAEHEVRQSERD